MDGHFGLHTDAAVRYYQAVNRFEITGEVDDNTAHALGVDLAAHEGGGRPALVLTSAELRRGEIEYAFDNNGANGAGFDVFQFDGPSTHTFHEHREYPQGGGQTYVVTPPDEIQKGHYRVTVWVNVTDDNSQGDDNRQFDVDYNPDDRN
jgi:hypothetical protein